MKNFRILFFLLSFSATTFGQADHWETAIFSTDTFRYFVGTHNPPSGWTSLLFDDSAWNLGKGGIGYGESNFNTLIPDHSWSVYLRKNFSVTDTSDLLEAVLNVDYDDAFVAWLNGVEIARANIGTVGVPPNYNTPASSTHEAVMYQGKNPDYFAVKLQDLRALLKQGNNVLSVQVNNIDTSSSDLSAHVFLSFAMKNPGMTYSAVPDWFVPPTLETGSKLPLLVINTLGQGIPHTPDKILVDFGIINNGAGNLNYPSDPWTYFKGKAAFAVRGSSSTMFEKQNYALETHDMAGIQLDTSILGLPTENDFVLYGPYPDKSLLRNYIMYYLGNDVGQWAPHTRMCELYLNNDYRGFYLLEEKIKRDKKRVNIAKLENTDISGVDLTGGYIIKIDRTGANYTDGWYSPYPFLNTNIFFVNEYPSYQDIMPVQKQYIQDKVTVFERLLNGSEYADPVQGYRHLIDTKSFAQHLILSELCKNVDAYRLSTFFYKDRDDRDPRIHMGPIWDYDLAFGNADYDDASLIDGWEYNYPESGQPFWWQRFMSDPWFVNMTKCEYETLRQGPLNTDSINNVIDKAIQEMGPVIDRNFTRWPILGTWVWPNNFVGNTYTEEINYLKKWILDRVAWMDNNMPGNCIPTGVDQDIEIAWQVVAYPNPAVGMINVEIQNPHKDKMMTDIFDIYGRKVYSKESQDYLVHEQIHFSTGTYILRVTAGSGVKTLKFVIQ